MELIESLDQLENLFTEREPSVMAFVPEENRFERLRKDAETLLIGYPDRETRPPLFGVPTGIKDIFHAAGFGTRAGCRLPLEELSGPEAESVKRLKAAGALVLGKTVTTEFAYFAPGPTRNPHNPAHTPGGSSSGSAAAVGAGMCTLALGTQTIGSITRPAAYCGVVGFKPSYDRISRAGVIPLAPSVDHVGVFTPDVAGAKLAASLLCRNWHPAPLERKPVLGIPEGPYLDHASAVGLAHFRSTCQRLAEAGFEIEPVGAMPDYTEIFKRHNLIVAAEAAHVHAKWFDKHGQLYHHKTADLITRGQSISETELAQALTGRQRLRAEMTALMDEHNLDLWLSPSAPGPAPEGLDSTGNPVMNLPWTHAGMPTLNLPSGKTGDGLPLGLQVAGGWYADEALLHWARDIERALAYKDEKIHLP